MALRAEFCHEFHFLHTAGIKNSAWCLKNVLTSITITRMSSRALKNFAGIRPLKRHAAERRRFPAGLLRTNGWLLHCTAQLHPGLEQWPFIMTHEPILKLKIELILSTDSSHFPFTNKIAMIYCWHSSVCGV